MTQEPGQEGTADQAPRPWERDAAHARAFVAAITELCCGRFDPHKQEWVMQGDPGARASLRSGIGKPLERAPRMHKDVLRVAMAVGDDQQRAQWAAGKVRNARERAYYGVAAMIADQARTARDNAARIPGTDKAKSLDMGAAVAEAVRTGRLAEGTADDRLRLLGKQSLDGVHRLLPSTIRLLRGQDIAVDWGRLIGDLSRWETDREGVVKNWLQSYYRTRYASPAADKESQRAANESTPDDNAESEE